MHSMRHGRDRKHISKKDKKLRKLINNSDAADDDDSEHELSYYLNDRVKMMKEVLKIIKPRKIRSMAPSCMRDLDNEEINSMILEELLGISNKRVKAIFNGQSLNEDSSSTDEEEQQPIDVISLDDISDDDFVIDLDSENEHTKSRRNHKQYRPKIKEENEEPKKKRVKKEKDDKTRGKTDKVALPPDDGIIDHTSQQHLMSVLELLELQARARAIRSQLALESSKKIQEQQTKQEKINDDDEDSVIVQEVSETEIIISSSDSEKELDNNDSRNVHKKVENTIVHKSASNSLDAGEKNRNNLSNNANTKSGKGSKPVNANTSKDCNHKNDEEPTQSHQNGSSVDEHVIDTSLPNNSSEQKTTVDKSTPRVCRHKKHKRESNTNESDNKTRKRHHKHYRKRESENENLEPQIEESTSKSNPPTEEISKENSAQELLDMEAKEKDLNLKTDVSQTKSNDKDSSLQNTQHSSKEVIDQSVDLMNHLSKTQSNVNDNSKETDMNSFVENDGDGIILSVDQSDMDCILLD